MLISQKYYKQLSGTRCSPPLPPLFPSHTALVCPHSLSPFRHSHRETASSTCQNFVYVRLAATDKPQLATHARRHSSI